jgi:hypothetical protein
MRVKLPDRNRHGVSPDRGERFAPLRLDKKLLLGGTVSTASGACRLHISSCPDLIRASINLRKSLFEGDGLPGQARQ